LCLELAKSGYDHNTGARSIKRTVDTKLINPIIHLYLGISGEVTNAIDKGPLLHINAQLPPLVDDDCSLSVYIVDKVKSMNDLFDDLHIDHDN
jgi:hypothetical protein